GCSPTWCPQPIAAHRIQRPASVLAGTGGVPPLGSAERCGRGRRRGVVVARPGSFARGGTQVDRRRWCRPHAGAFGGLQGTEALPVGGDALGRRARESRGPALEDRTLEVAVRDRGRRE